MLSSLVKGWWAMNRRKPRSKGQGLVEYALILVLVAVVTIVILHFFGQGAQRIFGLVAGAIGTKVEADGLEIGYVQCVVDHPSHRTSLWVRGYTKFPLDKLVGSTDKGYDEIDIAVNTKDGTDPKGLGRPATGAGTFKYNPTLGNKPDASLCPKVAVIQSDTGAMAVWPVTEIADLN
jgi:pilus assembly protein Flp/PilA